MRVNGLFGWVQQNNARSAAFLLAFALLSQPMAMVVLFVPLVFLDSGHAPWYNWVGYGVRYAPVVAVTAIVYFVAQMRRHVKTVRKDVAFRLVDNASEPRLCGLLEPLAIAAGLDALRVGVIDSDAMNAFACGVGARSSVAVFSCGIIDGLDDDELSAVIAHELIHIRNGDTRLIAAANVFMRSLNLLDRVNLIKPRRYRQVAILLLAPILFPAYIVVILLSYLCVRLGYASRLLISSSREFIADVEAIRMTQNPAALVSALHRIQGKSEIAGLPIEQDAMMIDGAAKGALATHPAIPERIEAIVAMTGGMALDARPRRDTRGPWQLRQSETRQSETGREGMAPNRWRKLAGVAAKTEAPRHSGVKAVLRVGAGGELGVFGLRWDIALAMLATFGTAVALHHGDTRGFFRMMGHALDRPGADALWLLERARYCRNGALVELFGGKEAVEDCKFTPEFADHAKRAISLNVFPDGRVLTDTQMAMLSPDEIEEANHPINSINRPFNSRLDEMARPMTELGPSYPVSLHEAWTRLYGGDLGRYLESSGCGIPIESHVEGEKDRSVTWRIGSEGQDLIRFTATLTAPDEQTTRISLAIDDWQTYTPLYDSRDMAAPPTPWNPYPVLAPPLRQGFSEAISAMLERRLFNMGRVHAGKTGGAPGESLILGKCWRLRERVAEGEHFSIHDPRNRQ
jgi:Zn-dependent protease with chaperone function